MTIERLGVILTIDKENNMTTIKDLIRDFGKEAIATYGYYEDPDEAQEAVDDLLDDLMIKIKEYFE